MLALINRFRQDESGASMVEYGLLVALIAAVVAGSAQVLGTKLNVLFNGLASGVGTISVPSF